MNFQEAKELFKAKYQELGFELTDEHEKELVFKYKQSVLVFDEEEIQEYAVFSEDMSALKTTPVECSICNRTFREQIVTPLDVATNRFIHFRDKPIIFGDPDGEKSFVIISKATINFVNYFRFNEKFHSIWAEKHNYNTRSGKFREVVYRPVTIQVYNLNEDSAEAALKSSDALIQTAFFTLTYLKNYGYSLSEEWPSRRPKRTLRFEFGEKMLGFLLPLPTATYNPDIIKFYQLGMSTDIPNLQFLAFYQILEYFFLLVADEKLYSQLSLRLNDPKFKVRPKFLDGLINDIIEHNRKTGSDETEMLKNVLKKYVGEEELIEFIKAYEEFLGEKPYTKARSVFGVELHAIKLEESHVLGSVAKTIKTVRNALVHSYDRHERSVKHIPFSKSTEIIQKEIPLIKYLAEKVIIGSAR